MSQRNLIEEVEARLEYIPRWKKILGIVLLIPPISILGMVFLTYELYQAGDKLQEDGTDSSSITKTE